MQPPGFLGLLSGVDELCTVKAQAVLGTRGGAVG
jgi:hypothetical protein